MGTTARARRFIFLVHRWTGVATCVLMALWLVSGVVMLYVGYPKLLPQERLAAMPALAAPGCCVPVETALAWSASPDTVREVVLTTVAGRPSYRLREGSGRWRVIDAVTGRPAPEVTWDVAFASARAFVPGASAVAEGMLHEDRWTHSGALDSHRPLFQVQLDDVAATRVYVSSATGEVVLDAPRAQRRWNMVGAWLHWLYMFREGSRDPVWSWHVIGLSAVGTVSALAGAIVGVWRWRFGGRYKSGSRSPYREFQMRWHHLTGLLFGTVLVAWIFSGLMSMNPLGVFDARGVRPDLGAYRGGQPGQVRPGFTADEALRALARSGFAARDLEWRVLSGRPYLLARDAAAATRIVQAADEGIAVTPTLEPAALASAAARLLPAPVTDSTLLRAHDAYYYQRQSASMYGAREHRLPVWRFVFADPGATRVYIDPHTGDVALSVDRAQRVGRWLFNFLHSWDLPVLLGRPEGRDVALIVLSLGSFAIALTGSVLGWRRIVLFRRQRAVRQGA